MPYILDSMTASPIAVYSLRKLVSGYSGSAIRVRRSNDNVEQDIGFTVNGDLDTLALSSFIGSNSGLVTIMYDQKGTYNATQTTAGNQPRIVNAGTIDVDSSSNKPAINYVSNDRLVIVDNNNLDFGSGNFTINSISRPTSLASGNYSIITKRANLNDTEPGWSIKYTSSGTMQIYYPSSNDNSVSTISINNTYILDYVISTNSQILYKNGTNVSSKTATSATVNNANDIFIGRSQTGEYLVGYVHEVLVFNTALSDTDRRYLETNQGDYYSVTVADPLYPTTDVTINSPLLTINQNLYEPSILTGITNNIPLLTIISTLNTPSILIGNTIASPILNINNVLYEPSIITGNTISIPLLSIDSNYYNPSVMTGNTITLPLLTLESSYYTPDIKIGLIIDSPLLTLDTSLYNPTLSIGNTINIPLLSIINNLYTPSILIAPTINTPLLNMAIGLFVPMIRVNSGIHNVIYVFNAKNKSSYSFTANKRG